MKRYIFLLALISTSSNAAVSINHEGMGELLLLPYYTVNNELNTLVSLTNTTDQSKAVKIIFNDAEAHVAVGVINVYLAPNDAWTWGMVSSEEGAQVISTDKSCAPSFISPLTLGLPDFVPIPRFEGSIEIYEMGALDPDNGFGHDITFGGDEPFDCQQISDNWELDGVWANNDSTVDLLPANGGLTATVSLVDVGNGINYSYDAIAIEGFYPEDTIIHTAPHVDYLPSLKSADTTSAVMSRGEHIETVWPTGFEAISGILSKHQLAIDYSIEQGINAQTEVVLSFPTQAYHIEGSEPIPPFTQNEFAPLRCEDFDFGIYNRDTSSVYYVPGSVSPRPPELCASTNAIKIWDVYGQAGNHPILDAEFIYNQSARNNSAGYYKIQYNQSTSRGMSTDLSETHTYYGLPVIALSFSNYTNANAQPGLLAQYGGAFKVNSNNKIIKTAVGQ